MNVHFISDLHLDFWIRENNPESPKFKKQLDHFLTMSWLNKGGEVLIIAGDLGHYFPQDSAFLLELKKLFKHVMLVRGNHDMYLVSNNQKKRHKLNSMNRINEMKEFCKAHDIHYLDGDIVEIDGIKFGGVGMSWDDSFYERITGHKPSRVVIDELYKTYMNDPHRIYGGSDNYEVPMAYGGKYFHSSWKQLDYFNEEMKKLQSISNVDVVVSHYAPVVPDDLRERYKNDKCSTFYYFDGSAELTRINPKVWVFGHTHDRFDFQYNETRMLCNPLGYPSENTYTIVQTFEV